MAGAVLRARSVTRKFGDFTAVDSMSMAVVPGAVVGLLGANGAGKTPLIRMLLGLLAATNGEVELLGGPPDRTRRARMGYVPQNLGLYRDLTVDENLAFSADAYGVPLPTVPAEFHDVRTTLVRDLVLGAQRQVAFFVALAHEHTVLVLDEPTSGVDALARARLWDTIRQQADRCVGVLVATHYMEDAQQCDRLPLMSAEKLVGAGSENEIIGDTGGVAVHTPHWAQAFAALNNTEIPVILDGQSIRVPDTDPATIDSVLQSADISAEIRPVRATIEERMLVLARAYG